jgi:flagellar motor component MotA
MCIGNPALLSGSSSSASRAAIASGVLGLLLGVIGALVSMDDPATLGFYLAITLISLLYAILLSELVFHPLACTVAAKLPTQFPSETTRSGNGLKDS